MRSGNHGGVDLEYSWKTAWIQNAEGSNESRSSREKSQMGLAEKSPA
jgi:hypothetical protein